MFRAVSFGIVFGCGCWRNWQVTCDSWFATYHIFYLINFFVLFCQFLFGCYYPHTLRHSVSPVCGIFLMYLTHEPLLLGIMPTAQSCPKLPFYPTPWTPSSVAWDMLLNHFGGSVRPLPSGRKAVNQCKPAFELLNCFVNASIIHDVMALWQHFQVFLNHHSVIHNGNYPPLLGLTSIITPGFFPLKTNPWAFFVGSYVNSSYLSITTKSPKSEAVREWDGVGGSFQIKPCWVYNSMHIISSQTVWEEIKAPVLECKRAEMG